MALWSGAVARAEVSPPLAASVPASAPAPHDASSSPWPAPPADEELHIRHAPVRAAIETGLGLVGGFIWYWRRMEFNSQDWDLGWNAPSWKLKLTSLDGFRFDTNDFVTNAQDHSRAGVAYYLVARSNGFELPAAFAIDLAASTAWEYLVEYREYVSINDLIINSTSGPAVGEPLLQIGRFFRRGRPTAFSRVMAALFSPFDELNGWLDRRPWQGDDRSDALGVSSERDHRLQMFASGRAVNFAPGQARSDLTLGIDLEVVNQRGVGLPGRWAGWTRTGDLSRMTTTFTFDEGGRWVGTVFHTETSLFGRRVQALAGDEFAAATRSGYNLFLGAGSGFDFSTRTLAEEQDRLAVVNLFGPLLELNVYRGPARLRLVMAIYGDFAMVDSHALGPESPADPNPPLTGIVRAQGYYYAYGGTGVVRAFAKASWWTLDAELRAQHFDSIDGPNREESPLDDQFRNLADNRLATLARLALHPWDGPLGIGTYVEWIGRQGSVGDRARASRELSVGVRLTLAH